MTSGEYRCPNCVRRGLPGQRFGLEIVRPRYHHGLIWPEPDEDQLRLFCLKCVAESQTGLFGTIGLVAMRDETGWHILTPDLAKALNE